MIATIITRETETTLSILIDVHIFGLNMFQVLDQLIGYIPEMYALGVTLNDSSVVEQVLNNPQLNQPIPARWSLLATPSEVKPLGILHGKQCAKRGQLAFIVQILIGQSTHSQ